METPPNTPQDQPDPSETLPEATVPPEPVLITHRPWLGPLIASGVLLLLILLLLIPRVLLYPANSEIVSSQLDPSTFGQAESSLEARAEELRALLESDVCIADGAYTFPDPDLAEANGVTEEDLREATLPSLDAPIVRPPVDADGDGVPDEADEPASPTNPNDALSQFLDQAVVLVLADMNDPSADDGTGSGFFVTDELIVTNGHVVGNTGEATVFVINSALGNAVPAEVVASTGTPRFGEPDFALLRLETPFPGASIVDLAGTPSTLTSVVAAGFPGVMLRSDAEFQALRRGESNRVPVMTKWPGNVIALQDTPTGDIIVHSAQITPGNSGGPLSDMCGRVTGVNTFIVEDETTGEHLYKTLSTEILQTWLSQHGVALDIDSSTCDPATYFNLTPAQ